jgi:ribulose-bisphosphate carboxylase large chain
MNIVTTNRDTNKYFWIKYWVSAKNDLRTAAHEIAIGQSIGNPNKRSLWETDEMIEDYCAKILDTGNLNQQSGFVEIGYPNALMDWEGDGISQLLCIAMGGQVDIDNIQACRMVALDINSNITTKYFKGPKYGIKGIRDYVKVQDKPLFGGIIKPKTGINPQQLLDMTKELVEGGVNFIKEDEILSNPAICPLKERVPLISKYLEGKNVVYAFCINSDPMYVLDRARFVADNGGNGVHINVWSGLGVYKSIRDLNTNLFIHYQKSGDATFSSPRSPYSISWDVLCQLAGLSGVDFIHAGMWGGYLNNSDEELHSTLGILRNHGVMPALSCGMNPDLVQPITDRFGIDWMANVGGYIHSDPEGTKAGSLKMRRAIDNLKL